MKYEWIDEYLMSKPGVIRDLQKEWNWVRYKLGSKMFAAVCRDDNTNEPYYITMKLEPMQAEALRREYEDIIPGYYMNKVNWNSVKADGNVPDDLLKNMLEDAYTLVLNSFSKKKQAEILASEPIIIDTRCGLHCYNCEYKEPCNCGGCIETDGHPFHGECPVAACCREKRHLHCGECETFPCELLLQYTNDPEQGDNPPGLRIEQCKIWCMRSIK